MEFSRLNGYGFSRICQIYMYTKCNQILYMWLCSLNMYIIKIRNRWNMCDDVCSYLCAQTNAWNCIFLFVPEWTYLLYIVYIHTYYIYKARQHMRIRVYTCAYIVLILYRREIYSLPYMYILLTLPKIWNRGLGIGPCKSWIIWT